MKVKDLMIGDWVAFRGHPYQYTANDLATMAECEKNGIPTDTSEIPLTDEILDANGYVREGGVSKWFDRNHFVSVLHWNENRHEVQIYTKGCKRLYDVMIEVHYVHELQHALRLCGIEKEIEL